MVQLWIFSQFKFVRQNNIDDVRPWKIARAVAPVKLHGSWMRIAAVTNAVLLTDRYAMSDFKSVWHKQIRACCNCSSQ